GAGEVARGRADRVRRVGRARPEHAGKRDALVSRRVRLANLAIGEVQPGEQYQLVTRLDPVERVGERGVDLEQRRGCAFGRLIGGVRYGAERRGEDPDRMDDVGPGLDHSLRESRTSRGWRGTNPGWGEARSSCGGGVSILLFAACSGAAAATTASPGRSSLATSVVVNRSV